jgi:hypothetical protein
MPSHWKLTWNKEYYDVDKLVNDFPNLEDEEKIIPCSRGKAHMKSFPQEGDIVTIVVVPKGKKIFSGVVIRGFQNGSLHQNDLYNRGTVRPHSDVREYALVKLLTILNGEDCPGGRQTWTRFEQ